MGQQVTMRRRRRRGRGRVAASRTRVRWRRRLATRLGVEASRLIDRCAVRAGYEESKDADLLSLHFRAFGSTDSEIEDRKHSLEPSNHNLTAQHSFTARLGRSAPPAKGKRFLQPRVAHSSSGSAEVGPGRVSFLGLPSLQEFEISEVQQAGSAAHPRVQAAYPQPVARVSRYNDDGRRDLAPDS